MPIELDTARPRRRKTLAVLVEDLLDASRVIRGHVGLRKERFDLADLVAQALGQALEECNGLCERRLALNLPHERVFGDADRVCLLQVSSSLIDNPVKFTAPGGNIKVTLAPTRDGCASVTIADDGIGIPVDTIDSVFDLFVQAQTPAGR